MNIYTVGRATQGFADYLNATFEHPTVAIARDSRNKGELFVKTTKYQAAHEHLPCESFRHNQ